MQPQTFSPTMAPHAFAAARALAVRRKEVQQDKALILLFLCTATATLLVSVALIVKHFSHHELPSVAALLEEVEHSLQYQGRSRDQFLQQMNAQDRRRFEHNIKYVADLIEQHRSHRVRQSEIRSIAEAIVRLSYEHNYDPLLVTAIIKAESTFNRFASSHRGAIGLMQLLPSTGKYISAKVSKDWHGPSRLTEPEYNIRLGIAYLQYLEKMFRGDRELALIAYNWGPGKVLEVNKNRALVPSGPRSYAKKILTNHQSWSKQYGQLAARIASTTPPMYS
ncbi:MAG: lytic transglycosylase domain-containing protein [Bdellovibrionota bacterium]|nr:MAG: lytic transglycosylase domain-containing protein [Bdellovibrionota bacterium]